MMAQIFIDMAKQLNEAGNMFLSSTKPNESRTSASEPSLASEMEKFRRTIEIATEKLKVPRPNFEAENFEEISSETFDILSESEGSVQSLNRRAPFLGLSPTSSSEPQPGTSSEPQPGTSSASPSSNTSITPALFIRLQPFEMEKIKFRRDGFDENLRHHVYFRVLLPAITVFFGKDRGSLKAGFVFFDLSSNCNYVTTRFIEKFKHYGIENTSKLAPCGKNGEDGYKITIQHSKKKDVPCAKYLVEITIRLIHHETVRKTSAPITIETNVVDDPDNFGDVLVIGATVANDLRIQVGDRGDSLTIHKANKRDPEQGVRVKVDKWMETTIRTLVRTNSAGTLKPSLFGKSLDYFFETKVIKNVKRWIPRDHAKPSSQMKSGRGYLLLLNEFREEFDQLPFLPYLVYENGILPTLPRVRQRQQHIRVESASDDEE
jgi:hypothetical protein